MMNIGLFGDSFTTSTVEARHFAWYNLLAEKLNGNIYNFEDRCYLNSYGLGASSTWYSYKKFLQYYDKHDLIIFVASDALKYPSLVDIYEDDNPVPVAGLNNMEYYLRNPDVPPGGKEKLKNLMNWYTTNDVEFMTTVQELILQDIERKANKVVILAAELDTAFTSARKEKCCSEFGMWDLARKMHAEVNVNNPNSQIEKVDKIAAHYTEETNNLFADLLYKHIMTGERMKLPEKIGHRHNWEYYFGN